VLLTALLISGSQVRGPARLTKIRNDLRQVANELLALPFSIVTNLCVVSVDTRTKTDDRTTLPLIGRVYVTHRRHNRRVSHQLFDLHNVNAGIC